MSDIAFVLGNGTSRKQISIPTLKEHGTIYACNAVYRECAVDHLIAVDTKMIMEIASHGYYKEHKVYTNPNKYSQTVKGLNLLNPNKGWSSGPTALWLASTHKYKTIYILGFDYLGIGNDNDKVNNLFADTRNYKRSDERATYYGNWVRQTTMTINTNPRTKYIRVTENNRGFVPDQLKDLQNLHHQSIPEFVQKFSLKVLPV